MAALIGGAAVVDSVVSGGGPDNTDGSTRSTASEPTQGGTSPAGASGATAARLAAIAENDRWSLLEIEGLWTAELASVAADGDVDAFLDRYEELSARYSDVMLAWAGDWPGSYDEDHRDAWVILAPAAYSDDVAATFDWCTSEGWTEDQCVARRVSDDVGDDPEANLSRASAP